MRRAGSAFAAASVFLVGAAGCGHASLHARAAHAAHGRVSFTIVKATVVASTSPDVSVLANKADATFRAVRHVGDLPKVAVADAVADVNSDGKPDLVTYYNTSDDPDSCSEGDGVSVCPAYGYVALNRGADTFAPLRQVYETDTADIAAVAAGDLNGDAKPDLAIAYSDSVYGVDGVEVLRNRGSGRFEKRGDRPAHFLATTQPPIAVEVADLNGDGNLDVVTANSDVADSNELDKGSISVFLSRGDGSFAPRRDYLIGGGADAIAVGDLNGDDRPDVAVARGEAGPFISVLFNRGDGAFAPKRDYRGGAPDPYAAAIGDLDGDGHADLATVSDHGISVLLNRRDGKFRPKVDFRMGTTGDLIASGDLNGDGRRDLVITSSYGAPGEPALVLVNRG